MPTLRHVFGRLRRRGLRGVAPLAVVLLAARAGAQGPQDDPRWAPPLPRPEWRLEGVAAEHPSALAGAGVSWRAGWYVRLAASLAAGAIFPADAPTAGLLRADAVARFQLDPFAERRRGLYAGGGLSVAHAGASAGAQAPVLLLVAGLESRPRNGRAWALELGVGGGLRVGVVWRGARRDGHR